MAPSGAGTSGIGPRRFRARVLTAESPGELAREIESTDSDPEGVGIMTRKGRIYPVRLEDVPLKAAPLLKQEMLSVGGDAAHARGVADLSVERTTTVLLATSGQYRRLLPKLRRQPFQLSRIGEAIEFALHGFTAHAARELSGAHRSLRLGEDPLVMGVVNVTPDSFSDGGKFLEPSLAIEHAVRLAAEGAELLDVGGESTRPGSSEVGVEEEWRRIGPVLEGVSGRLEIPLSVDTRHAEVARRAVAAGADIVNDVSGLRDPAMRRVVAESHAAVVVMDMRGEPSTMQGATSEGDGRSEVFARLQDSCAQAVEDGIDPGRIIIDPGLGFGKSYQQNLSLLAHLREFRSLGFPVAIGASRKSFLGTAIGGADIGERLEAGLAAAILAASGGADIIRTHDVAPTRRALRLWAAAESTRGGRSNAPAIDAHGPDEVDP